MLGGLGVREPRLFLEETGQGGPLPPSGGSRPLARDVAGLGQEAGGEHGAVSRRRAAHGKHPVVAQVGKPMQLPSHYEKRAPGKRDPYF